MASPRRDGTKEWIYLGQSTAKDAANLQGNYVKPTKIVKKSLKVEHRRT